MKKQVVAAMLAVSLSMSVNTPVWAAQVENNAGQAEEKETNEVNDEAQDADAEEQSQETGDAESRTDLCGDH